jgi:hypothetical protein
MGILLALLSGTVVGVLAVFLLLGIVLSVCRLATGETGQLSREQEKQAAAKGLLYKGPTEREAWSPDELLVPTKTPAGYTGSKAVPETVGVATGW